MELEYLKSVLGTLLFVKVPRPGDSEGPFRLSSQAASATVPVTTSLKVCYTERDRGWAAFAKKWSK